MVEVKLKQAFLPVLFSHANHLSTIAPHTHTHTHTHTHVSPVPCDQVSCYHILGV
jgi:hypothetical protein